MSWLPSDSCSKLHVTVNSLVVQIKKKYLSLSLRENEGLLVVYPWLQLLVTRRKEQATQSPSMSYLIEDG